MSTAESIAEHRREKDRIFKNSPNSPLLPEQQGPFTGLSYYDYNPALDLEVEVDLIEAQDVAYVHTTRNEIRNYTRYGTFTFDVDGEAVRLTIYKTPHGFFIPFVDANAGMETYPAGRYIDPEQLDEKTFLVDFNLAYSPLCAYNDKWNCPITPAENRLSVAIRAGEKIPTGEWVKIGK